MKPKFAIVFVALLSLAACESVDRSKPEEVLNAWLQHSQAKEYGDAYDLLSVASKKLQSKDDYVKAEIERDTLVDYTFRKFSDIAEAESYQKVPGAKRMMAKVKWSTKVNSGDRIFYYTLIWDKPEWSVANDNPLTRDADKAGNKGDLQTQRQLFQEATKVNPYNVDLHKGISYSYYLDGRLDDMKRWLDKGLAIDDKSSYLHNLYALYLEEMGEPSLALKKLELAADLAENDGIRSAIYTNASIMSLCSGDYDRAEIYLRKAKKLDQNKGATARAEAELFWAKKDYRRAADAFSIALASETIFTNKKRIAISYIVVLSALQERNKARDILMDLLVEKPDDDELLGLYQQYK